MKVKKMDSQRCLSSNPLYSSDVWPQMAKKQQQRNKWKTKQTKKQTKKTLTDVNCRLDPLIGRLLREMGDQIKWLSTASFEDLGRGWNLQAKKDCVTSRSQGTGRYELYCYKEMSSSLEFFERNEELWISWL